MLINPYGVPVLTIKSGIQNAKEWQNLKGSRPNYIPLDPPRIYYRKGWKGWSDFQGKED